MKKFILAVFVVSLLGCGKYAPLATKRKAVAVTPISTASPSPSPTAMPSPSWTPLPTFAPLPSPAPRSLPPPEVIPAPPPPVSVRVIQGMVGKAVYQPVSCVFDRSPYWLTMPTQNWHPLSASFGGEEIGWESFGKMVTISLRGTITVGVRTAAAVLMELFDLDAGPVHRAQVIYAGVNAYANLAFPIQFQKSFPVLPNRRYALRVAYYSMTADDNACTGEDLGMIQLSPLEATVLELP